MLEIQPSPSAAPLPTLGGTSPKARVEKTAAPCALPPEASSSALFLR